MKEVRGVGAFMQLCHDTSYDGIWCVMVYKIVNFEYLQQTSS